MLNGVLFIILSNCKVLEVSKILSAPLVTVTGISEEIYRDLRFPLKIVV